MPLSGSRAAVGSASSRTAQRRVGSALSVRPSAPRTSSNSSTSPARSSSAPPLGLSSVAVVDPVGRVDPLLTPCVEVDHVARGTQRYGMQRVEDDTAAVLPGGDDLRCRVSRHPAVRRVVRIEDEPGPGRGAFVHRIVQQPGMAADRDAAAGGAEVGLGGHKSVSLRMPACSWKACSEMSSARRAGCGRRRRAILAHGGSKQFWGWGLGR